MIGKELTPLERKRVLIFSAILIVVVALLACDTGTFTAFLDAGTATPTRTPRGTFTPRATATPEETPTPEATPTTAASPSPTLRPTLRPATKPPTAPPPPPKPQFTWRRNPDNMGAQGLCPQSDGVYEIKGRLKQNNDYAGGIHIVALDSTGKMIKQMDSLNKEQMNLEWGVNCREEKNLFNYQLDVTAGRMNQPFIIRITRSAADLTPISPDVPIQFESSGGRFYLDWVSP
jgi:hypothetical protein